MEIKIDKLSIELILSRDIHNYYGTYLYDSDFDASITIKKNTYFIIYKEKDKTGFTNVGVITNKRNNIFTISPRLVNYRNIDKGENVTERVDTKQSIDFRNKNIEILSFIENPKTLNDFDFDNINPFYLTQNIDLNYTLVTNLRFDKLVKDFKRFYFFDVIKSNDSKKSHLKYFILGYYNSLDETKVKLNYLFISKNNFFVGKYSSLNYFYSEDTSNYKRQIVDNFDNFLQFINNQIIEFTLPEDYDEKIKNTKEIIEMIEEQTEITNISPTFIIGRYLQRCIEDDANYYEYPDSYFFSESLNNDEWKFYLGNYNGSDYSGKSIFIIDWVKETLTLTSEFIKESTKYDEVEKKNISVFTKGEYNINKYYTIFNKFISDNNDKSFNIKLQKRIQLSPNLTKDLIDDKKEFIIRFKSEKELTSINILENKVYFTIYDKLNNEIKYNKKVFFIENKNNIWDYKTDIDKFINKQLFYINFPLTFDPSTAEQTEIKLPESKIKINPSVIYKDLSTIKKPLNDFSNKSIIANGRRNSLFQIRVDTLVKSIYINNTNFQNIKSDRYYSINFHNNNYNIKYLDKKNKPTSKFFKFNKKSKVSFRWVISNGYLFDEDTNLFTRESDISLYDDKEIFQKTLAIVNERETESEIETDSGTQIEIKRETFNVDIEFDVNFNSNLLSINSLILKLTEIKEIKS